MPHQAPFTGIKKFPLKEAQNVTLLKNIYALSKKVNEEMAEGIFRQFNISFIGLRFFTVYGQLGKAGYVYDEIFESSYDKKIKFFLNNFGEHTRDFTYVGDACKIVSKVVFTKKIQA